MSKKIVKETAYTTMLYRLRKLIQMQFNGHVFIIISILEKVV